MLKRFRSLLIIGLASIIVIPCSAKSLITISYNGEKVQLEHEAQRVENSVLLPLRSLSQFLGYTVNWDQATKQIDIIEGGTNIQLIVGNNKAQVNEEEVQLSVPAQIIEGIAYVPLRFVGEALSLDVDWDKKTQTVNLEGKYTIDKENKKLLVRTKDGKKVLAEVTTLNEYADYTYVSYTTTKNESDLVSVSQTVQGAAGTAATLTTFYIKEGKIIDKVEKPFYYIGGDGIVYFEDTIAFCDGTDLKIYDDRTGSLISKYDLDNFQEGLSLELMKLGKNYAMGRYERTIHVIDFETGKVTRILDLIPEEDKGFVFQTDMQLARDDLKLVWEVDTALVFKYYSPTEQIEKSVTCKLGR